MRNKYIYSYILHIIISPNETPPKRELLAFRKRNICNQLLTFRFLYLADLAFLFLILCSLLRYLPHTCCYRRCTSDSKLGGKNSARKNNFTHNLGRLLLLKVQHIIIDSELGQTDEKKKKKIVVKFRASRNFE